MSIELIEGRGDGDSDVTSAIVGSLRRAKEHRGHAEADCTPTRLCVVEMQSIVEVLARGPNSREGASKPIRPFLVRLRSTFDGPVNNVRSQVGSSILPMHCC